MLSTELIEVLLSKFPLDNSSVPPHDRSSFHSLKLANQPADIHPLGGRDVQLPELGLEVGVDLEECPRDGLLEVVRLLQLLSPSTVDRSGAFTILGRLANAPVRVGRLDSRCDDGPVEGDLRQLAPHLRAQLAHAEMLPVLLPRSKRISLDFSCFAFLPTTIVLLTLRATEKKIEKSNATVG